MAVNIEHRIPALKVIANPLIGPVPIKYKIRAVNSVVTLASRIVIKARSYPDSIALKGGVPFMSSSFILSKIITFASTAIPTVNIKPAIPGRVSVAPKNDKIALINIIFIINAIDAMIPASL